nr:MULTISPECIES: MarR family transcriptional regulator [unclassified Leucobacter]
MQLVSLSMLMPSAVEAQLKREAGMNLFEYHVLAMLSDAPERARLMSDLAFHTNSSLSRLSHVVTRLEKQGWVRREPCASDKRATNAVLTDAGFAQLADSAPEHVGEVRRLVFDALDPSKITELSALLQPVLDQIDPERRQIRD